MVLIFTWLRIANAGWTDFGGPPMRTWLQMRNTDKNAGAAAAEVHFSHILFGTTTRQVRKNEFLIGPPTVDGFEAPSDNDSRPGVRTNVD